MGKNMSMSVKKVPFFELEARMKRFRDKMDKSNPEWRIAVIFSKINMYYFTGTMQDGMLLIPRDKEATLWVRRSYERALDESAFELLTSMQHGKLLLTLAPETTTPDMIRRLARAGVVISAGHTNARYGEIRAAIDAGVRGFTHLFNAMSPLTGREPGTVGAALEDLHSWCGLIVDGHHVDPVTMKLALRCKPIDRFMLVTDAMPTVGMSGEFFMLQGRRITVRDGMCFDEAGTLAGSNLDMASAVRNAVRMLGVDLATAVRMASEFPAAFLGLERQVGRIAAGMRANFVVADEQMNVSATWIDGQVD